MNARRIALLEERYLRRLAAEAGAPYGLTADQVLQEARDFLSLPPEVQQRELELAALQEEADAL
jgi:hypothetical protein